MTLQEFETHYRNEIEESLNQLQTAVLLVAQLQIKIISAGENVQNLSHSLEEFLSEQKTQLKGGN